MKIVGAKVNLEIKFIIVMLLTAVIIFYFSLSAHSCTIAVVSSQASLEGRPVLWKNYDMSQYWHQQVKYFQGENDLIGNYYLLHHDNNSLWAYKSAITPQAGINEAGFSIVVAAVSDINILNASTNANTRLLMDATANCASIPDFDNYLQKWRKANLNSSISANYAVIDARGGAAIYEVHMANQWIPLDNFKFRKYDANTGQVSDHAGKIIEPAQESFAGYYVSSNLNSFFPNNTGSERAIRAEYLFKQLKESKSDEEGLTPANIMRVLSKDVKGIQPKSGTDLQYSTTYCISRSQTRSGLVVEGAAAGEDPALTTFWCALGEPSLSVYVPTFVGAGNVSPYLYEDTPGSGIDKSDVCALNLLADQRETYKKLIYSSNRGNAITGPYDTTINKIELAKVQDWTLEIEKVVLDHTREFIARIRNNNGTLDPEELQSFQNYCAQYVYENYAAGSADAVPWEYHAANAPGQK